MIKDTKKILFIAGVCLLLILAVAFACLRSCAVTPAPNRGQETTLTPGSETEAPSEPDGQTVPAAEQETTAPTGAQNDTAQDEDVIAKPDTDASDTPPVVEIPDVDQEQPGLQFPCEVPGHDLKIEKLASYAGLFVEDGTNAQVTDVAMLLIRNTGKEAVEYTEITVQFAEETLTFQITALPAGESMVVQEKTCKPMPENEPLKASALVIHRAQMAIAPELTITDNGDNSLTIKNLTNKTIPTVRVFYKYYMENEDLFVGGIAFSLRVANLQANGSLVVKPAHFISASSRVVMALTYDTNV